MTRNNDARRALAAGPTSPSNTDSLRDRKRRVLSDQDPDDPDAVAKDAYQREVYRLARLRHRMDWAGACEDAARQLGPIGEWVAAWRKGLQAEYGVP